MARFVLRRALRGLVTLWLVVTAVFVVLRLSGDPTRAMLGPDATPAAVTAFRVRHGLDDPIRSSTPGTSRTSRGAISATR